MAEIRNGLPRFAPNLRHVETDNISPIALFYAGERIDIKSFYPHLYTAGDRLKTMLNNPLSVVEYFRNTIGTIIQTMLKGGMFSELIHYHGPIEYQGQGTPHAHLVVCPPPTTPPSLCFNNLIGIALDKRRRISSLAPGKSAGGSGLPREAIELYRTCMLPMHARQNHMIQLGNPGAAHFNPCYLPIIPLSKKQ
jgi:hypothetical protein